MKSDLHALSVALGRRPPCSLPAPESMNWYTTRQGGNWHDACRNCDRTVVLCTLRRPDGEYTQYWRHTR